MYGISAVHFGIHKRPTMSKFIKIRTKCAFPVAILILFLVLLNRIEHYPYKPSLEDILAGRVTIQQDDERLINYIKDVGILRPPTHGRYSLQWPHVRDQSTGQAGYILSHILKNKRNGFFVECGALDGETRSNTLFMERNLGWTGLLVEADPANFKQLLKINRNAWSSNVCLATKPHPHVVKFQQNFNIGKIIGDLNTNVGQENLNISRERNETEVQCIPFFTLMSAMNIYTVDYFSLDVEGSELKVLKTIPFDKILIKVLSVEYVHTDEGKNELQNFMENWGYTTAKNVHFPLWPVTDLIFIHNSVN